MSIKPGYVDYRNGEFVAGFDFDATVFDEIKRLQGRRWVRETQEWLVARSHRNAAGLLGIARKCGWDISPAARDVCERLQDIADATELSVDVVQGSAGEPWFFCLLGDDEALHRSVKAIPKAFLDPADDSWWVPAFRADSAEMLLEIVHSDARLFVSDAAWRLLAEPDLTYFPSDPS